MEKPDFIVVWMVLGLSLIAIGHLAKSPVNQIPPELGGQVRSK
jgi:hypothetical protein